MKNDYEMITVREYADSLKNGLGYYTSPMMSAKDYADELRAQSMEKQKSTLITVKDYVKSLEEENVRYLASDKSRKAFEDRIAKAVTKTDEKSEKNAKIVENLLA